MEIGHLRGWTSFPLNTVSPLGGLRVSSVRLTRPVKTAHRGYEGGTASVGALQMAGGWTAMLVMERHREEATMDRQLTVIAGMDGAYRSELILDWLIRDRAVPTIKLFLPKRNRNVLARKFFLSLFYPLLEVFARPDDDSCMTGLNLDVVHPSEAWPDPAINCSWILCFHYLYLSTTCHNAYCRRPRLHKTPAIRARIVARSRGC